MKDTLGRSYIGGNGCCSHNMRFEPSPDGRALRQRCRDCGAVCACMNCSGLLGAVVTFFDSDAANYAGGAAIVAFALLTVWLVIR